MEKLEEKNKEFFDISEVEYFERDPLLNTLSETQYFQSLENKTQVIQRFLCEEDVSTKLSHTLQVMQLSERIAEIKNADTETTLRIAAFHDCGHTPFGYTGERVMRDIIKNMNERDTVLLDMIGKSEKPKIKIFNNFKHEILSARIFDKIVKENDFEIPEYTTILEGIIKHGGGIIESKSLEGKIVGIADKISYLVQDIKDAQKNGFQLNYPQTLGETPEEILNTLLLNIEKNYEGETVLTQNALIELNNLKNHMYVHYYNSEDIEILDRMIGNTLQTVFLNWCSKIFELRENISEDDIDIEYYRDFFNLRPEQKLKSMLSFDQSLIQFISLSDDEILERSEIQTKEELIKRAGNYKKLGLIQKYGIDDN